MQLLPSVHPGLSISQASSVVYYSITTLCKLHSIRNYSVALFFVLRAPLVLVLPNLTKPMLTCVMRDITE